MINATDQLIAYLSQYTKVSPETAEALEKHSIIKSYAKGSHLLREGDFYNQSLFVLSGCVRSYTIKNGDDITIDFYLDEQPIMPSGSDNPQTADFNLECLEDSLILTSTKEQEEQVLNKHPGLKAICLKLSEHLAAKLSKDYSIYKTSSAEERYIHLINSKPELFKRVPQYQIATYLGIKPESLSRIKKRLKY